MNLLTKTAIVPEANRASSKTKVQKISLHAARLALPACFMSGSLVNALHLGKERKRRELRRGVIKPELRSSEIGFNYTYYDAVSTASVSTSRSLLSIICWRSGSRILPPP